MFMVAGMFRAHALPCVQMQGSMSKDPRHIPPSLQLIGQPPRGE